MPPVTYPNQRLVTIHKADIGNQFLGINKEVWMAACRDLGYPATILYLYLSANANNYQLALSPAAVQNALGMPRTTYRDQIRNLINKGYLVEVGGNRLDFYEVPKKTNVLENTLMSQTDAVKDDEECAFAVEYDEDDVILVHPKTGEIIEINNKYDCSNTDSIDNTPFDFSMPLVSYQKIDKKKWSINDF